MRYIATTILIVLINCCLCFGERYAIIIAVGDYPQEGGWPDISSQNDIIHVKSALSVLGFNEQNISVIQDQIATKAGIVKALEELLGRIEEGDMVFIHFSGHGQQVLDDNGDEIDLLDEAIVPFDSPIDYSKGVYEGQNLIRDDFLADWSGRIRTKCGPTGQLILVLDSCHSGSGTRGMAKTRGTDKIMAPKDIRSNAVQTENKMGLGVIDSDKMAPMASFFGAASRELNYETLDDQYRPVGSLTYSLYSVLANLNVNLTFEDLYNQVRLKMKKLAPLQNPQWEGPQNVLLFGGEAVMDGNTYLIKDINDSENVILNVGTLRGIFEGTQVEIFLRADESVLGTGLVSKAHLTESHVALNFSLSQEEGSLMAARIVEKSTGPLVVTVRYKLKAGGYWDSEMNGILMQDNFQHVSDNADIIVSEENQGNSIKIMTKEGYQIFNKSKSDSDAHLSSHQLTQALASFNQGKFLRSFESQSEQYDFTLEIIQLNPENNSEIISNYTSYDDVKLKVGSVIKFRIRNKGRAAGYFSLVDIQPDNFTNLLIPAVSLGYEDSEYYLEPGESYETNYVIEIAEPLGLETLKLISSKEPLNLSRVIGRNASTSRGNSDRSNLEELIAQSYIGTESRGMKVSGQQAMEYSVRSMFFDITK